MGNKPKTTKAKAGKCEIVTGIATVALPVGVRTSGTADAGYRTDDADAIGGIGEIAWWMTPSTRKNYKKVSDDAASSVSNMLYAVAFVAQSALSAIDSDEDEETLVKVMHAITATAYASNDIQCAAHYAGIQFEQKYPEYQKKPPTKRKPKSKVKAKSK